MAKPRNSTPAGGNVGLLDTRLGRNRSGVWEIQWTEYDAGAGRSRSRSYSCRTRDEVEARAVRQAWVVAGLASGAALSGGQGGTVADLIGAYLRDKGFVRSATQVAALRMVSGSGLGGRVVEEMSDSRVLLEYRLARGRTVAPGTIRRELGALKAAIEWGRRVGMVRGDLRVVIDLPPEGAPRTRYLSEDEAEAVWEFAHKEFMSGGALRNRRAALFVCIAMETAARAGAIRGLTWGRVDLVSGLIDFRDPTRAVSKKRRVAVPISDKLRGVLEQASWGKGASRVTGTESEFVLGGSGSVQSGFEGFRSRLGPGVGPLTIHDMRRTWASLRMQWGVPIEQVAAVLGDTVEITARHYAHFSPSFLRGAINAQGRARP